MFSLEMEVTENDIDERYRHVHHARALCLFEAGRLALLEKVGCSNEDLLARGMATVITRVSVEYRRELFMGPITVCCEDGRVNGKSVLLKQRILNEKGKEAVVGDIELKIMHAERKRAIEPPADFTDAFEGYFKTAASAC